MSLYGNHIEVLVNTYMKICNILVNTNYKPLYYFERKDTEVGERPAYRLGKAFDMQKE